MAAEYTIKDSGTRLNFDSGMLRDSDSTKARFDLLIPEGVPYDKQLLNRFAMHLMSGAKKYDFRNWEKANSQAELDRFKESALRHMMQWICGETDEDHASAILFNVMGYETTLYKINKANITGD